MRRQLELAVAVAKFSRDCVVAYGKEMRAKSIVDLRTDCPACHTKFAAMIPIDTAQEGALHCPNCGATVERPPGEPSLEGDGDPEDSGGSIAGE